MAGTFKTDKKPAPEILFDLLPEDDLSLKEADLLQFVNHGQLQKQVDIPGVDGRVYKVEMALLWDDDHIDVLRRTSAYANDPLLRVKLMRRLKLHKAIQTIGQVDYTNKEDPAAQRQLWTLLARLSDSQMEYLDSQYVRLELERNMSFIQAIKALSGQLDDTAPRDLKPRETKTEQQAEEHVQHFEQVAAARKVQTESLATVIEEKTGIVEQPVEGAPRVGSPKQSLGTNG